MAMDSIHQVNDGSSVAQKEAFPVDPILVEALESPRHRLTVLRMELDIQKFLQNPEQLQFEFQHFPSSYHRLAAHRVAQHYGLQTMVLESGLDGLGNKILVMKTPESKYPCVCLSDIPLKQPENHKLESVKIAIRPRPSRASSGEAGDMGSKHNRARTVEERKEEYDRARARIFSSPNSPTSDDIIAQVPAESKIQPASRYDPVGFQSSVAVAVADTADKSLSSRDFGSSSRVAIFRDREKDRTDPDYDRSYERYYAKSFPVNQRPYAPFNMPNFQPPLVQYNAAAFPQMGVQMPGAQSSLNYGPSPDLAMNQFSPVGMNQASRDAVYMQWPSPAMMYAHTYEPFRHAVFQAPFCQQPLSFDYAQNHH
jgi:hypothetical protein